MKQTRVYIASDHAGFEIKKKLVRSLPKMVSEVFDLGVETTKKVDYPDLADQLCQQIIGGKDSRGVLICGSGQGMAMRANKYPTIRAALCWSEESARLARKHNDANVLCLGSRLVDEETILKILKAFLETDFEGGRHQNRVKKLTNSIQ